MARASHPSAWRYPIWLVLAATFGSLAAFAIALGAAVVSFVAYDSTYEVLNSFADREITNLKDTLEAELDPALEQVRFMSGYVTSNRVSLDDNRRLSDLLMGSLAASPQLTAVAFIRPDMTVIEASRQRDGELYVADITSGLYNAGYRQALRVGSMAQAPAWGIPIFLRALDKPVMSALAPVRKEGEVVGVFAAVVSLPEISQTLNRRAGENATPFVLGDDGAVFSHRRLFSGDFRLSEERPLPRFDEINDPVLAQFDARASQDVTPPDRPPFKEQIVSVNGVNYFLIFKTFTDLIDQPLTVGVYLKSSVIDNIFGALWHSLYGAMIVIAAVIVFALFLGRRIGNPMHKLAEAQSRLVALDFKSAPTLSRSRFREIDVAASAYNSMRNGLGWFSTYVPGSLVPHLMSPESSSILASREVVVTVLFTDIVGFSGIAQRLSPRRLAAFLNRHFTLLGQHIVAEGGSIDKYIGDSIMAFWGAPEAQEDHAPRAVRAAQRITARLDADNARRAGKGLAPVRVRIGIHSGTVIAGNIGAPGRINYTLVGDTVNIAQRLEQFGKQMDDGKRSAIVSISADTAKLLPADTNLTPLGREVLPGRRDETEIYRLE